MIASTGIDSGIGAVNPLLYRGYYYNLEYYIDLSELSNKQYKLLKDTIKDVDEK